MVEPLKELNDFVKDDSVIDSKVELVLLRSAEKLIDDVCEFFKGSNLFSDLFDVISLLCLGELPEVFFEGNAED